ncbi:hypothetical protein [Tritonibacter mobilis]|uniref:hypothetical protein n=1 Tax=Tritonibacter mobilis TaxID=379347 RepID=UPI00089428F8|nr:hypothetical protein [Tritonibacter mobilis]GLP87070.1 hypothetical protein GCM10007921_26300 [Tritonibacter mobilis]SDW49639.1 hypothetical protein SAMN05444385_102408 [Tritonibacter mobilis]
MIGSFDTLIAYRMFRPNESTRVQEKWTRGLENSLWVLFEDFLKSHCMLENTKADLASDHINDRNGPAGPEIVSDPP